MKKNIVVPAQISELDRVLEFIDAELEQCLCPMKYQMQLNIAIEEIFVNIARYAYNPEIGEAQIGIEIKDDPLSVCVQFLDSGRPYNPLEKEDPDITLSAEDREAGGLGIFMVKKSMDNIEYEYKDGRNILTLKKHLK